MGVCDDMQQLGLWVSQLETTLQSCKWELGVCLFPCQPNIRGPKLTKGDHKVRNKITTRKDENKTYVATLDMNLA